MTAVASSRSTPRACSSTSASRRAAVARSASRPITVLDLGVGAGVVDDPAQLGHLRRRRGHVPSAASSRAAVLRPGRASSASATSTVRLPSIRSSPAGLPVVGRVAEDAEQVVAQLERLAQRQPERAQLGQLALAAAGQRGADVERPLDGVLRRLVAQHGHRRVDVGDAARLHRHVEELAGDHLASGTGRRRRAPARPGPAAGRTGGAARRTSSAAGRRAGSPRTAPYCSGSPRQPSRAVLVGEAAVGGRPAAPGVGGVHVVVVHQRAGVEQLERGAGPHERVVGVVGRARRPRGSPSSRTPRGTACRPTPTPAPRPAAGRRRRRAGRAVRPARRGRRRARPARARGTPTGPTRARCWSRAEPRWRLRTARRPAITRTSMPGRARGLLRLAACPTCRPSAS